MVQRAAETEGSMKTHKWVLAWAAMGCLFSAMNAQAQWVMVARAVAGRIERMTNKPATGSGQAAEDAKLAANFSRTSR